MAAKNEKWPRAIEHRFNKTELALQKINQDFNGDHIHEFRVEIKKLKALIRLISYDITGPTDCRFPKPLNKLYKALGSVREWQIQKENIVKAAAELHYATPLAYIHKIHRKTDSCKHRVSTLIRQLPDMKKMMGPIQSGGPDELSPASIIRFIQTKIHEVHEVLQSGNTDDESMHDMRKKIKDVQYVLSGSAKTGEIDEHSAPLVTVQEVSGLLGDFHDLCIALALLKKELKILPQENDEKKLLRKIRDAWQARKLTLRQHTLEATRTLINRHFSEALLN